MNVGIFFRVNLYGLVQYILLVRIVMMKEALIRGNF